MLCQAEINLSDLSKQIILEIYDSYIQGRYYVTFDELVNNFHFTDNTIENELYILSGTYYDNTTLLKFGKHRIKLTDKGFEIGESLSRIMKIKNEFLLFLGLSANDIADKKYALEICDIDIADQIMKLILNQYIL